MTLVLRRAALEDEVLLLLWRNDPITRGVSFSPDEISPEEHHQWFVRKLEDPGCALLIVECEGKPIGQVRLDRTAPGVAEISIGLAPDSRGRGLGREALGLSVSEASRLLDVSTVTARVKRDNRASLASFTAAGFLTMREDAGVVELARQLEAN